MDELELNKLKKNEYHAIYQKSRRMFDDEYKLKTNESAKNTAKKRYDNDPDYRRNKNIKDLERYYKKREKLNLRI
jgi:hypothetical protein